MRTKLLWVLCMCIGFQLDAQSKRYDLEMHYYYGSILPHSEKIKHLITDHPEGIFLTVNQKTLGDEEWHSRFNFPDLGLSFHFQNNKNDVLGDLYGLFAHYSFYFFDRSLMFRVGQGVAYNTNPYDKHKNYMNYAFSTHLMPTTMFMLNYSKENIYNGLGVKAGAFLVHHSNGTMKSPNTSTNTVAANIGLSYDLDYEKLIDYTNAIQVDSVFSEPIKYNFALRSGVQESRNIGLGQEAFYFLSAYADKRISRTSAFQAGVDVFISPSYRKEIDFMEVAFPELGVTSDISSTRIGLFAGYEMFINRLSFESQLGFYVLDEYKANTAIYQRLGLKYYLNQNLFVGTSLKTHFSKAEAMEFSLGVRL